MANVTHRIHPGKELFLNMVKDEERAGSLLRDHLPTGIAAQVAEGPVRWSEESFLDEAAAKTRCDVLFKLPLKTGGVLNVYLVAVFEKPPSEEDFTRSLEGSLLRAKSHLAESYGTDEVGIKIIWPMVMYFGSDPWGSQAEPAGEDSMP